MDLTEKEGKKCLDSDHELSTDMIMRRPSLYKLTYDNFKLSRTYARGNATPANAGAEGSMAHQQASLVMKTWKQTSLTVIIALVVVTVAVVLKMVGATAVLNTLAGAATGAATGAGVCALKSAHDSEVRVAVAVLGGAAIMGGVAGILAAKLLSLLGVQSLTGSAVLGAIAGAAIVSAARPAITAPESGTATEPGAKGSGTARATVKAHIQAFLAMTIWKQTQLTIIIISLVVIIIAVVLKMVETTAVIYTLAGAATGAGICVFRSIQDSEVNVGVAVLGCATIIAGAAGILTAKLLSLLGVQSLTGSAVLGSISGAAIVSAARPARESGTATDSGAEKSGTATESGAKGSGTAIDSGAEKSGTATESGAKGSGTAIDSGAKGSGTARAAGKAQLQAFLLMKTWKQTHLTVIIISLVVVIIVVVLKMVETTAVINTLAGATTGAGICAFRSLQDSEVRVAVAVLGGAAIMGGVAGILTAKLLSLLGVQSLTVSAVLGSISGAAIVSAARPAITATVSGTATDSGANELGSERPAGKAHPQAFPAMKTWKQKSITVIIALVVVIIAVVLKMVETTAVIYTLAGATTGAGICAFRSLQDSEVRVAVAVLGCATIIAGAAGILAAKLLSLLGVQSLTVSAVLGSLSGAAIVLAARPAITATVSGTATEPGATGSGTAREAKGKAAATTATAVGKAAVVGAVELIRAAGFFLGRVAGMESGINRSQQKGESKMHIAIRREHKNTRTAEISQDNSLRQKNSKSEKTNHLFHRLCLHKNNNLRVVDVLQIQSHESCVEEELALRFLLKLLKMNYRARCINVNTEQDHTLQRDTDSFKDSGDIFGAIMLPNEVARESDQFHPMDVQMAAFYCADGLLKQLMVTKLSQCQFALPLLVPDPFTQLIEFPLWTFRQIHKSWRIRNTDNEITSQTQMIYRAQTPMVFFFRFGSVSSSKSQLMNSLINEKHNTFFHRNCPGSSRIRVLMDGVVEIAWFCPSGKDTDTFTDCVSFCNLHGDAGDHEKQLKILTEMASVNVVFLPQLDKYNRSATIIQKLYNNTKPLIYLLTDDESSVIKMSSGKFKIGLKDRNQSDVSEELRKVINDCLSESSSTFSIEDVCKHSDIRVDEKDDEDCKRGREAAQQMMNLLENKDLAEIKESFLPHQGKLWHEWSQKNKELHRPQGDETEIAISRKQHEIKQIRQKQHECNVSEFTKLFIKEMSSDSSSKMFFLKWLRILMDEHTSADLSLLHCKYNEKWSTVIKLKDNHGECEQFKAKQTELEKISHCLQAATFGVEHIMREISQIYESCSSVKKNKKDLQVDISSLPSLAAEMMISGFPLELMDGDAAHVPVIWISAVLDQLIKKLGDQTRVFVVSVLGLQNSGKTTMLNAMFGLQFPISVGRCTRGAFMQLVKVSDEMKTQMNIDYILVVDTEGLRALELAGRSTRHHDNELATFIAGLGNLTLINIFGENPSEMQDLLQIVVQAFMRIKKVRLNPNCVFVHQNISDVTAGEKNMERRRRLKDTLDEMTKLAAKEEVCDAECFSDIIRFDVEKDVKYFSQLWEGSPPMAPPNPNYCENAEELKKTIFSNALKSDKTMLKHVKNRINDLWGALLHEKFAFSFRNSLETSAYKKLETEYSKWSWSLQSAMMETKNELQNKIENKDINKVDKNDIQRKMKATSEGVEKSMTEFFENDKEIVIQWKVSFDNKINELQENITRETMKKLNEVLQQRDLKQTIVAQNTQLDITLLKESKDFALNLKDKATDGETQKKEFDLFWKKSVEKIIKDTPPIKDIDVMGDLREILCDIYKCVGHRKESSDILSVQSYSVYIQLKQSSGSPVKEASGLLSKEDETQIRSLTTDILQQTDKMIQSFNFPKIGYNITYIHQVTDYIKAQVTKHEEKTVKYVFKNEFFMDLVLSFGKRSNNTITVQHRHFREANDPVVYVEKKREEYYSIFQKYCNGATSAAILGGIICQKLKEPIEQSVYKKTARDLAGEMRSNCPSLNGNRSNLEKHILKTLAEENNFSKYMNYIETPRDHFKGFIRDEVSQYITDNFNNTVLPKMEENIELLQKKILEAAHISTEHVLVSRGDVCLWFKSFTQRLSDDLILNEKHLSGIEHEDGDVNLLEDVIRQELPDLISGICSRFNTKTFDEKLDLTFRPDEILIGHLCQCCWVQCPFCKAICTNTIEGHDGDHSVPFHRVDGINGWHYVGLHKLCENICTSIIGSNRSFIISNGTFPYKEYRTAGGVYAEWSITPDLSELAYWKWFVCTFQKELEEHHKKKFKEIPDEWKNLTKTDAIESLDKYIY